MVAVAQRQTLVLPRPDKRSVGGERAQMYESGRGLISPQRRGEVDARIHSDGCAMAISHAHAFVLVTDEAAAVVY